MHLCGFYENFLITYPTNLVQIPLFWQHCNQDSQLEVHEK